MDACKEAGVKHIVYSGLESAKQLQNIDVAHFDGKAEVEQYLQESGKKWFKFNGVLGP